jgi:hypothetical protein
MDQLRSTQGDGDGATQVKVKVKIKHPNLTYRKENAFDL